MTLLSLKLRAGVNPSETEYSQEGGWIDSDNVRFFNGRVQKVGGWEKLLDSATFIGICRRLLGWRDDAEARRIAIGTHKKLYYYYSGTLTDITPIRESGNLTNPFTTTSGSALVDVTDAAHGLSDGDYVIFSGASAVGGITIDGTYTVTQVTGTNNYTITHSAAASSGASGGGTVAYQYEIGIGLQDSIEGRGYGVGTWGSGTYGSSRTTSFVTLGCRTWSLEARGENLIACPRGGSIYEWDPDTGGRAAVITNAPTTNVGMIVTEERMIVALGAGGNKLRVQWCDQEDDTIWTPAITNTAGDDLLSEGSEIIAGMRYGSGIFLVWTDTALFKFQFVQDDLVYHNDKVGNDMGLIGPAAAVEYLGRVWWMHQDDFMVYDGAGAGPIPRSADIRAYVFDDINLEQASKFHAGLTSDFSEIHWYYCSAAATEIDRCVSFHLTDQCWTICRLSRTAAIDHGVFNYPVKAATDGYLYNHEIGTDADGAAMEAYITTAPMDIGDGERLMNLFGLVPDIKGQVGSVNVTVYTRDYPNSRKITSTTYELGVGTEIQDMREQGRTIQLKFASNEIGGHFRLGRIRLDAQPAGKRR